MFICNFEKGYTLHFLFLPVLVLDVNVVQKVVVIMHLKLSAFQEGEEDEDF